MATDAKAAPKPAAVYYNDWRSLEVPPAGEFCPRLPVSVIIPCYQTPEATLARTLAGLEGQTYPPGLFEVVLVDDGSAPPLRPPASSLDVTVVAQERRGVGIARARNTGARAAAHDVLLFLDSDMLVEADWLAAHARWHHAVSDALTVGFRAHVAMDDLTAHAIRNRAGSVRALLAGRPMDLPRMAAHLIRTRDLTARADDLFRVVEGADFGIAKPFYWAIGGSDESFTRWGMEDIELAWRAFVHGGLFIPVTDRSWHQSRDVRGAKECSNRKARGKAAHHIPHPEFRSPTPGRAYAVPQHVVTLVDADCPPAQVINAATTVLADRSHDLVVRIALPDDAATEQRAWLQDVFGSDPRVCVVSTASDPLAEHPTAPYHITLPANVVAKHPVSRLRAALGGCVRATAVLADGGRVSITRTWALHRARRIKGNVSDVGEEYTFAAAALGLRIAHGRRTHRLALREAAGTSSRARFLALRWRNAHGWRETWWWLRWVLWWCARRLRPAARVPRRPRREGH